MMDVLIYLFEEYFTKNKRSGTLNQINEIGLFKDLEKEGFSADEIGSALNWLELLSHTTAKENRIQTDSMRLFQPDEVVILGEKGRKLLCELEMASMIDADLREKIIDLAMQLKSPLSLQRLKWVTMMARINSSKNQDLAPISLLEQWLDLDENMATKN